MKWQQRQSQQCYLQESHLGMLPSFQPDVLELSMMQELSKNGSENGWSDFGKYQVPDTQSAAFLPAGFGGAADYGISRTASCPPVVGEEKGGNLVAPEKMGVKESLKKRKADKSATCLKVCFGEEVYFDYSLFFFFVVKINYSNLQFFKVHLSWVTLF